MSRRTATAWASMLLLPLVGACSGTSGGLTGTLPCDAAGCLSQVEPASDSGPAADRRAPAPDGGGGAALDSPAGQPGDDASAAPPVGDANAPADPCPDDAAVPIDCDPACGAAVPASCTSARCATKTTTPLPVHVLPYVIRTPDDPGTDSACASQCPDQGFVYGLGFTIPTVYANTMFRVSVEAPWMIITDAPHVSAGGAPTTPYCDVPDADVESTCVSFLAGAQGSIYVMTRDPHAPARNITVQVLDTTTPPNNCPYH